MPDNIERTIYRLELDDSGYVRGVESMSESTKRLVEVQNQSNKQLQTNEAALKANSDFIIKAKKDLDAYTGSNEAYRKQLEKQVTDAQGSTAKLTATVNESRKAYEAATKAAQDFAATSSRATNLQPASGGRVNPPIVPPVIPPIIPPNIFTDLTGLSGLDEIVANTKEEFNDLQAAIILCEEVLKDFDPGSEEFKVLTDVIAKGKQALLDYENANKKVEVTTKSYRAQIAEATLELKKLEEQGKENTKEFLDQEIKVAKLTDAYEKQRARIKVLGSDTRALDFGKAGIQAAITGFQAYTSLTILAGGASEKLQKRTMELFAAMQLLASLEQLSILTKKGSIIATNVQSASTAAYNFVVNASTTALKAYRAALLATGIGAAIVAIGFLVKKFIDYRDAVKAAAEQNKLLNEVIHTANQEAGKQLADLKLLTQAAQDSTLPMKERLEAVRALQAEFPDYFGSLSQEAILTGDITKQTEALTIAIQASSRARAAKGKIDAIEAEKLDNEFQRQKIINATNAELARVKPPSATPSVVAAGGTGPAIIQPLNVQQQKDIITQRRDEALADVKAKDDALDREENFLLKFVDLEKRIPQPPQTRSKEFIENAIKDLDAQIKFAEIGSERLKNLLAQRKVLQDELDKAFPKKTTTNKVDNIFEEERLKLTAQLSDIRRTQEEDIKKINDAFIAKLDVERKRIEGLIKDKKVTGTIGDPKSQAGILFNLAVQVNKAELDKALADFSKKVTDAMEKLNTEIAALQLQADRESILLNIAAIQDDFDKRAALIDFNEKKEIEDAKLASQKRLDALELNRLLIGEEAYQDARFSIIETGEQNVLNLTRKFAEERNALAEDKFFEFLTFIDNAVDNINLEIEEALAKEIQSQSDKFVAGKISFEQYQKAISEIQRRQENIRRDRTLFLHKVEIEDLEVQLNNIDDKTSKKYIRLQEKLKKLREKYAKEQQANAQGDAADTQTDDEIESARLAKIRDVATAIGEVTNSIIGFWQQANAAEAEALDRSIALQEKRVDAAQRIAERGNASYLKAETDRLKELQVARENAARRELAINAALQASQLLVGITGAITKIATPGVGTADVIASIAVIFAALATGYGLVKSLQGNQPQFKEGTTYVERGARPRGVDTVPAWLSEGEAVIPEKTNKSYKKAVEAIYHEKVPAKEMNEFVENYVSNNVNKSDNVKNESKYYTENLNTYSQFVRNVSNVPTSVLNEFISNYISNRTDGVKIPVIDRLVKEVTYSKEIASEAVANYSKVVNIIHTVKPMPQVNYSRIGEAATTHIQHDGKLAGLLVEQNRLLVENTDVQRATMRALQKMGVSVNMDRNGIAVSVMETVEQIQKDKRL